MAFTINVVYQNKEIFERLKSRLSDFKPAFEVIRNYWVANNATKFDKGRGMEASGLGFEAGISWQRLTRNTMKLKRHLGLPDWLMVHTGGLMRAMTSPSAVQFSATESSVEFGQPINTREREIAEKNLINRPVVFLDEKDRQDIRMSLAKHIDPSAKAYVPSV